MCLALGTRRCQPKPSSPYRAHSTKIDVNRLNSFLTLRSSGLLPAASSATAKPTHVFEAFERYDFSHDPGFEAGINAILERHKEGKDRDDAVEKAKSWYYNRLGIDEGRDGLDRCVASNSLSFASR